MTVQPLTPPEPAPLVAPQPVVAVSQEDAVIKVSVDDKKKGALDAVVATYVDQVVALDVNSAEFDKKADDVRTMGDKEIKDSSSTSSRLLAKSLRDMDSSGVQTEVPKTLLNLRREIEKLDPKQATGVKKLFGMIPFGDSLTDYFRKYESSQKQLDAILNSLLDGKDELTRDNADLAVEKVNLWDTMAKLREFVYIAEQMDEALTARIEAIRATDPARASKLESMVLFYVRQKRQDLLTQLTVAIQGYEIIDLLRKNNIELIKGVDRSTTTTMTALRQAVLVSQALGTQKLVLDQINALNSTTSDMILATSEMLKTQSADINKQAASATIDLDKLTQAFANIYQAMDAVDTFKAEALVSMSTSIEGLQAEIDKSSKYLDRIAPQGEAGTGIELP